MEKSSFKGVIKEDLYGYRTPTGYNPSLYLKIKDGENIPLGNGYFKSIFTDLIGRKIKLTIKVLD